MRINLSDFRGARLPLAPRNEQRRIVAKVDSLSVKSGRARDHLDHLPRLVEKYKQSLLAATFRGELTRDWRDKNPSTVWTARELADLSKRREIYLNKRKGSRLHAKSTGEVKGDRMPRGWFSAQLADVGSLQVGYAYKSQWYAKEGIRLLRGANISPGQVSWEDEVRVPPSVAAKFSEYRLDAGDIVIAMDRPIISTGLKVARIKPSDAGCLLVQRVARYVASELADEDYVWYLVNSSLFVNHAVSQVTGSDLPHISSNDILTTPLPLPCMAEQKEIVQRIGVALSWIDRLVVEATGARKLVDRLDQAVLARTFRGELVPQDPNDEPAASCWGGSRLTATRRIVQATREEGEGAHNGMSANAPATESDARFAPLTASYAPARGMSARLSMSPRKKSTSSSPCQSSSIASDANVLAGDTGVRIRV